MHPLKEHRWGQRVIRFYDSDGNIIEAGEEMGTVMQRFAAKGMAAEEIAVRMGVPLEYVREEMAR